MLIASFGASAALVFNACGAPLAQPRNVIGGHFISAVVGVSAYQCIPMEWLAVPVACAGAIGMMDLTKTLHPPAAATAIIAVIGSQQIHDLGFAFALVPCVSSSAILVATAIATNRAAGRTYPVFWW